MKATKRHMKATNLEVAQSLVLSAATRFSEVALRRVDELNRRRDHASSKAYMEAVNQAELGVAQILKRQIDLQKQLDGEFKSLYERDVQAIELGKRLAENEGKLRAQGLKPPGNGNTGFEATEVLIAASDAQREVYYLFWAGDLQSAGAILTEGYDDAASAFFKNLVDEVLKALVLAPLEFIPGGKMIAVFAEATVESLREGRNRAAAADKELSYLEELTGRCATWCQKYDQTHKEFLVVSEP